MLSVFGWLGAMAFNDVKYLNRNAVMRKELEEQFEKMRRENIVMHQERLELTKANHEENKERFDRIETKMDDTEQLNREIRHDANGRLHELVTRIEEVNANSIARDAMKEDRKS